MDNRNATGHDPELQPYLSRDALLGLDRLLTGQRPGETIACDQVGALVRLVLQAGEDGTPAQRT